MDAHKNEYAAAVAGMTETYGTGWNDTSNTLPAIGDFVSGFTAGRRWSGHVEWIVDDRMTINVGGGWLTVPVKDITH